MTWGKVSRMYGLAQTLRRRSGQDPLNSLSDKDVTVLLYPPPKGNTIATEKTWKQAKKSFRSTQALQRQTQSEDKSSAPESRIFERKKPRMIWPEERLMWEVYRRSPELKQIPYDLNSFEPPFAKRFALRQYQLMQQGMSKEAAYQDTEKEMAMHKQELLKQAGYVLPKYSVIATIQEQEEKELAEAYEEYQKYK